MGSHQIIIQINSILHNIRCSNKFPQSTYVMGSSGSKQDTNNAPNHQSSGKNLSMQAMMCTGNATPNHQSSGKNLSKQAVMCTGNATPNHQSAGRNLSQQEMM